MSHPSTPPAGFIGVGSMGGAISRRILAAGLPLLVYDVNEAARAQAAAHGATLAGSVREVADTCEVVFACLPTLEISRQAAFGPDGVAGGKAIKVYGEISTLGGDTIIEIGAKLSAHGVQVLDSPVIGSTMAVDAGNCGVLVSGPKPAFETAKPWFDAYAGRLFYLGPGLGTAQAAKVMNNAVAYASTLATCEALALGLKSGLDMETALAILNQGSGRTFLSDRVFPAYYPQDRYDGMGAMRLGVKDMDCFLEEAARLGMPTPMAAHVRDLQAAVLAADDPARDMLQMIHYFTDLAGMPRRG